MNEYETEVHDTLRSLLSSFSSDVPKPAEQPLAADNGKGKQVPIQIPSAASPTSKDVLASLETIGNIDAAFHALSSEFEFPHDLDFDSTPSTPSSTGFTTLSDPEVELKMAYTSRNTPVRYYEHALSALLTQLDAVESFDNEDVRAERKKVVAKVEKALQELENEIGESLEKFKWRLQREAVSKEIVEAGDSIPISEDTEAAGVGANVTPAPLDVSMDDAQQSTDVPSSSDDLPSIEPSYSYQDSAAEVHPTIEAVAAAESQSAESASPEAEELSTEIAADNSADIVMTEEAPLPSSSIPTETIQPDHSILLTDIIVPDHDAMAVETTQYAVEPRESQLMESVTTDLSINASNEDANPDGVVDVNAVHCRSISPHISAAHPPVALTVTSPTPTTSSVSIDSSPSSPQLDTFLLPASSSPLQSPIAHDIKDDLEELVVVEELDGRSTGTSDREDGWSEVEA
ncbi:hypothetical protein BJ138DRAFT_1143806 [Hygrophoropsis aurantiaca]|uniref:Uncharacterized protein n=1 Tax=Hygrophoropsis aurantiaca TaxID=72124 RepID=A0ACB8AMP5_9AGAM|nr:hypothetical protein BJ138DRAFT_1143806 [Hygrophoropsis aurantiaca]